MTDIDPIIRAQLEQAFPMPRREPDWRGVLGRRRRRRFFQVAPAAVAVVVAVIVVWVAPWNGGTSFVGQALAAVGDGRWITSIVETNQAYTTLVNAQTGEARPALIRMALSYDRSRQRELTWQIVNGRPLRFISSETAPQPQLADFVGGYLQALQSGSAREVGSTTYRGRPAEVLRFKLGNSGAELVAVDRQTHAPIWFRQVLPNETPATFRVVSISSSPREAAAPKPLPVAAYLTWHASTLRAITVADMTRGLGQRALWSGHEVGPLTLDSVVLQRVTRIRLSGLKPLAAAPGLRLLYSGKRNAFLEIDEQAKPYGFDFYVYPGLPVLAGNIPVPESGAVVLSCNACGYRSHAAGYRPLWTGQLRDDGLYVRIQSFDRRLVLLAARLLRVTP